MEAAFALLDLWMDYMHSTGHVRYAPDFFFVGTGFAGAFLLEVSSFSSPRRVSSSDVWVVSFSAPTLLRHWMRSSGRESSMYVKMW